MKIIWASLPVFAIESVACSQDIFKNSNAKLTQLGGPPVPSFVPGQSYNEKQAHDRAFERARELIMGPILPLKSRNRQRGATNSELQESLWKMKNTLRELVTSRIQSEKDIINDYRPKLMMQNSKINAAAAAYRSSLERTKVELDRRIEIINTHILDSIKDIKDTEKLIEEQKGNYMTEWCVPNAAQCLRNLDQVVEDKEQHTQSTFELPQDIVENERNMEDLTNTLSSLKEYLQHEQSFLSISESWRNRLSNKDELHSQSMLKIDKIKEEKKRGLRFEISLREDKIKELVGEISKIDTKLATVRRKLKHKQQGTLPEVKGKRTSNVFEKQKNYQQRLMRQEIILQQNFESAIEFKTSLEKQVQKMQLESDQINDLAPWKALEMTGISKILYDYEVLWVRLEQLRHELSLIKKRFKEAKGEAMMTSRLLLLQAIGKYETLAKQI